MKPMYLSIRQEETGEKIRSLIAQNGYTVKDIQNVMRFWLTSGYLQMDIRKVTSQY